MIWSCSLSCGKRRPSRGWGWDEVEVVVLDRSKRIYW